MAENRTPVDLTVNVPDGELTIEDALLNASTDPEKKTKIVIKKGHLITNSTLIDARDFRHVTIVSEDDEIVLVNISGDLIKGINGAHLPTIDCLFDMQNAGQSGIHLDQSVGSVIARSNRQTGIINAGVQNLYLYGGSHFNAIGEQGSTNQVQFTGASKYAIFGKSGSHINIASADLTGCETPILTIDGCHTTVNDCTMSNASNCAIICDAGSTANITNSNLSNAGNCAVYCDNRSWANCMNINFSSSGIGSYAKHGSTISINNCNVTGCTDYGTLSYKGSWTNIADSDMSNCGIGAFCVNGSHLSADGCTINNCVDYSLFCYRGCWASAINSDLNASKIGIYAVGGCHVDSEKSNVLNNSEYGIQAVRSHVYFNDEGVVQQSGAFDIGAKDGGYINIYWSTYDTADENDVAPRLGDISVKQITY